MRKTQGTFGFLEIQNFHIIANINHSTTSFQKEQLMLQILLIFSFAERQPLDTGQIKGLSHMSLPASVVSSRRGSGEWDPATHRSGKPSVKVECENGQVFYADQVICTIPLGLLQKNPNIFDPPLPKEKQESANKLVFGVVNKIFLSYDQPFLNPEISEIITLWNRVDEKEVPMEERWFRKIYSFCKGRPS